MFDDIGLFDESLPACEDYELFLRLTCRYEVLYLEEKLTVKYGGHADQLSRAHPAMDRFRVQALDRLLADATAPMTAEERTAARDTLIRKAAIVRDGALKHGNPGLQKAMAEYLSRWGQHPTGTAAQDPETVP